MPAKPAWLLRSPEIDRELQALTVPVIDCSMWERLFCVRRRRAITLMQEFGACQSGRTLLVERISMIKNLEALREGQEFEGERPPEAQVTGQLSNDTIAATEPYRVSIQGWFLTRMLQQAATDRATTSVFRG